MNWGQLSTVIWLRWRLTRNQMARGGKLNFVISIIGLVFGVAVIIGASVGGVLAGTMLLPQASPMVMMLVWDGIVLTFLFAWVIGVLAEIQRSESIDLARLLHLPVSLQGIFVMNYIASLVTLSIIVFVPLVLGLCAGLVWASGLLMLLLAPLALSFIFMVSAWTYCLRGWLVAMMVNPRKRRNVVAIATLTIVLLGQAPNLYFNVFFHQHLNQAQQRAKELRRPITNNKDAAVAREQAETADSWERMIPTAWIVAQNYVPVLWLPKGAMALMQGNVWPSLLGSLGAFLLGVAGLARAYKSTIRFYLGQDTGGAFKAAVPANAPGTQRRRQFMERPVPFVGEDTAALALAFFRSLSRAPEVKMALFTNIILIIVLVPLMLMHHSKGISEVSQLFYATGAVGFTFFGLLQQMFNLFGYDREGFRSLVLSPATRRNVLLAKNISLAPVAFGLGAATLAALTVVMHLPLLEVAAALFKLAAIFLLLSVVGNWISVWVPYRVTAGSLKPTKPPAKTVLLMFLTQLSFPVVMMPIFVAPLLGLLSEKLGWWPAPLVDGLVSICLLAVAALIYAVTLNGLGDMLEDRERKILLVVSREGE